LRAIRILAVALVTLAALGFRPGITFLVLGQAPADIVGFLELAFFVAANISFVGAGIDQFALGHDPLHEWKRKRRKSLSVQLQGASSG
jgi:hypothetical protein